MTWVLYPFADYSVYFSVDELFCFLFLLISSTDLLWFIQIYYYDKEGSFNPIKAGWIDHLFEGQYWLNITLKYFLGGR